MENAGLYRVIIPITNRGFDTCTCVLVQVYALEKRSGYSTTNRKSKIGNEIMHILVTNDDGVQAPGLLALAQEMRKLGKVTVFAPDKNWSASGHVKTMERPLACEGSFSRGWNQRIRI